MILQIANTRIQRLSNLQIADSYVCKMTVDNLLKNEKCNMKNAEVIL